MEIRIVSAKDVRSLARRFPKWTVQHPGGCLVWKGGHHINARTRSLTGKQVMWAVRYGYIPKVKLRRACQTPDCVQPDHLFESTIPVCSRKPVITSNQPPIGVPPAKT